MSRRVEPAPLGFSHVTDSQHNSKLEYQEAATAYERVITDYPNTHRKEEAYCSLAWSYFVLHGSRLTKTLETLKKLNPRCATAVTEASKP